MPTYINSGTYITLVGNVVMNPVCPGSIQANDLLLLAYGHLNSGSQVAATYSLSSSGWTSIGADRQNNARLFTHYKVAAGTESSLTLTIRVTNGITATCQTAVIHQFRSVSTVNVLESSAVAGGFSAVLADTGVTSTQPYGIAVNMLNVSTGATVVDGPFTGAVGGIWAATYLVSGASGSRLIMETATITSSGTIDGGVYTMTTTSAWVNRGFVLLDKVSAAGQLSVGATGLAQGTNFGALPVICPQGF